MPSLGIPGVLAVSSDCGWQEHRKLDCIDHGAGLYSTSSQAQTAINQSRVFSNSQDGYYASSADIGQKGAKKFLNRYGEQSVCVSYRYDEQRRKRGATVEIIIEEFGCQCLALDTNGY